jgi:hypothetical protein
VLTAYGPGAGNAPLVAYLGPGPHLQVQYMAATPNPAKPGDQVTVSYMTLNADGASLAIGTGSGSPVPLNDQAGQTTITAPASSTVLVLTVTANGQAPVSSEFDLVVSPG